MARLKVARLLPEEKRLLIRAIEIRETMETLGEEYEDVRKQLVEVIGSMGGSRVFRGTRFELRTRKYYRFPKKVRLLMKDLKILQADIAVEKEDAIQRGKATLEKEVTYLTMETPK